MTAPATSAPALIILILPLFVGMSTVGLILGNQGKLFRLREKIRPSGKLSRPFRTKNSEKESCELAEIGDL